MVLLAVPTVLTKSELKVFRKYNYQPPCLKSLAVNFELSATPIYRVIDSIFTERRRLEPRPDMAFNIMNDWTSTQLVRYLGVLLKGSVIEGGRSATVDCVLKLGFFCSFHLMAL